MDIAIFVKKILSLIKEIICGNIIGTKKQKLAVKMEILKSFNL